MNLFRYCGDDPVDRTDPTGEMAEVTTSGDNVTIWIPIHFSGAGATPSLVQRYVNAIESRWTGQFGKYHVVTAVDTTTGMGKGFDKFNKIEIMDNPQYRSRVTGSTHGKWNSSGDKNMPPHEAGHLMGLPDRYRDVEQPNGKVMSVAKKGYENNIMGNMAAKPSEKDIHDISANRSVNQVTQQQPQTTPRMTAATIDAAHQALGVPSLGAEAVNSAPGRP